MTDVNFPQDFYLDDVGVWRLKKEKLAELEKPKPMTNEEWLRQCTTEESAKEIYKIAKDDFKKLRKLFYGVANDDCDAIALWLKQPHKEVEE